MEMKSVEELDVFKLAHELALTTYSTTKLFPREETFSLVDQMRRAAAERVPRVTIFTNFLLVIRGFFFRTAMRSPLNSLYNLHKAETQQLWDGNGDKNR